MKKLLVALLAVFVVAGCSIFGSDGSDMFGAWEKVSSDRGEYRGVEGTSLSKVASVVSSSAADTIDIDTLFINSDERISISITENSLTSNISNDLLLELEDNNFPYDGWGGMNLEYVTDSTAFDAETNSSGFTSGKLSATAVFTRYCGVKQSEQEFLNMTYLSPDSTGKTVYSIRVDGMVNLVEDLNIECVEK